MLHTVTGVLPSVGVFVFLVWFGFREYHKQQKSRADEDRSPRV